jgi:hypothetical protein
MIPAQDTVSFNLQHDTALVKTKSKELLPLKALGSKSLDGLKMLLEYTFFLLIWSRGWLLVDLGYIILLLLRSIDRLILLLLLQLKMKFLVVEIIVDDGLGLRCSSTWYIFYILYSMIYSEFLRR